MSSLGNDAYVGTLHYQQLEPPISAGSGVQNPMDANLDGGGFAITNTSAITTGTLNYTTLNPPLPTSGVDNPMTSSLDGGNFNITNTSAITTGTLNTTDATVSNNLGVGGGVSANSGSIVNNWLVGGNTNCNVLTVSGATSTNTIDNTDLIASRNYTIKRGQPNENDKKFDIQLFDNTYGIGIDPSTLSYITANTGFHNFYSGRTDPTDASTIPSATGLLLSMGSISADFYTTVFARTGLKFGTANLGTFASPVDVSSLTNLNMTGSLAGISVFGFSPGGNLTTTTFNVSTGIANVLTVYSVQALLNLASTPGVGQEGVIVESVKVEADPSDNTKFFVQYTHTAKPILTGLIYKFKIILID